MAAVADQTGQTKADAGKAVDAAFTVIAQALASGDEVKVPNFGSFSVAERAAREGRNPQSGEKITIAASKQAKFSAAKGRRTPSTADRRRTFRIILVSRRGSHSGAGVKLAPS